MNSKKTAETRKRGKNYSVRPSDSKEWVLVKDLKTGLEVDVEIRVLDYRYDCAPKPTHYLPLDKPLPCSFICCYTGCYASPKEISIVEKYIDGIVPLLSEDGKKTLAERKNKFWDEEDADKEEDLYKIICTPEEWDLNPNDEKDYSKYIVSETGYPIRCVFLMDNGYCAVHAHFEKIGVDWVKNKFNICTTFPLDIRPQDKTIAFMKDFDSFTVQFSDCICNYEERKKCLGLEQIITTCKYSIIDRYNESFWVALNEFAEDFRSGKIAAKDIL